jgi:hypothetical protein
MCGASGLAGPRASSVWDDAARRAAVDARAVTRYLPILGWLPRYERQSLPADALAGLSVWALLVPQSLAYATLAGVPVQYGLYTALLMYPIFGTSRQLAEGPSAAVCAVVAATITPLVGAAALGTRRRRALRRRLGAGHGRRVRRARAAADGLGLDVRVQGGHGRSTSCRSPTTG